MRKVISRSPPLLISVASMASGKSLTSMVPDQVLSPSGKPRVAGSSPVSVSVSVWVSAGLVQAMVDSNSGTIRLR